MLHSIQKICLRHGEDVSYYMQLFQMIEAVMEQIENDDMTAYLRFLEDTFPCMEKYQYVQGMELVLNELSTLLEDKSVGCDSDRALLLNYHVYCEKKPEKAIKLQKEAVAMISEITPDNALLASNLYSNLGRLYRQSGKLELAKQNYEETRIERGIWSVGWMFLLCWYKVLDNDFDSDRAVDLKEKFYMQKKI